MQRNFYDIAANIDWILNVNLFSIFLFFPYTTAALASLRVSCREIEKKNVKNNNCRKLKHEATWRVVGRIKLPRRENSFNWAVAYGAAALGELKSERVRERKLLKF